jgi:hypothetical protein
MNKYYLIALSCLFLLAGCVPGAPPSDPLCLDCYYDVPSGKMLTPAEMEQAHPGSTTGKYY